ncbi:MAG: DNA polymerase III subunit gamma/tau [Clostridia bacterium]|nr:DNA polymerase III subunit gamma/tau [Clostridia bacterium]
MHQALYRKWRPKTFDDVCGQEHITSVLRYEIKNGAPSHAYLFCGSRGTGKTTCAKILAKAVNCEAPVNGSPCCKCPSCLSIENGSATDVLEMDAASNNGVENIRDIRDEVVYTPSQLRYRVYIVDEVHMLSTSAFNALLKTLEEPPAHVIFILATTELHKLPATIVSRCQRFDFRRIASSVLASRISYIAKEEQIGLDPVAAERIARMAQGGMRDAISLLELCAGGGGHIDTQTVDEMMGSVGRESILSLVGAVANADYDAIFEAIDEAVSASRDLAVFWQDLIGVYRDMLVMKTTDRAARYLDLADAEASELKALAARFTKGTLLAHCRLLEDALFAMQKANAVKRMVAELTLVRMCDPRLDTSVEGLVARIEKLEDAALTGALTVSTPPKKAEEAPTAQKRERTPQQDVGEVPSAPPKAEPAIKKQAPTPAVPKAANGGRILTRMRGFINCVERIRRENAMLASFLSDARAYFDEQKRVVVILPNAFAEMMLEQNGGRDVLRHALCLELAREVQDRELLVETRDAPSAKNDTIIDDILSAAEGGQE